MAMPAAGFMPVRPRGVRAKSGEARGSGIPAAARRDVANDGKTPVRGTLLPSAVSAAQVPARASEPASAGATPRTTSGTWARGSGRLGVEATLQRTAEQQATEETLGRLVRQCMAGDQQAWQQLVTAQHRRIYAICYRFTGSAMDAEDLTQEVFLKLYRNLASFDTHKGSFQTWITTLARNLLVDHFRRTRMERATDSLDAGYEDDGRGSTMADRLADTRPTQEAHASGLELKARIQQALKQLSPELREAVVFRDLEDMDYKEIAQVLRIPEGTVKSRISRGRGELARLLQRIEGQAV